MPHTVHITAIVNAPLDKVWPMFRDFNGLGGWHPGVAESRLEEGGAMTPWARCGTCRSSLLASCVNGF